MKRLRLTQSVALTSPYHYDEQQRPPAEKQKILLRPCRGRIRGENDESVGVPGLEPGTSASQTQRASQLRHTPPIGP